MNIESQNMMTQSAIFSPLMLSDRLLTLAEDADRAGYRSAAQHLLSLASKVLDKPARSTRAH